MKSKVFFFIFLFVALLVTIAQKNNTAYDNILKIINPIKQTYKRLTQEIEDRSQSYIFQKESIEKLTKENKVLKKYLLDQTQYLQQVNTLYKKMPSLEKLPYKSITLVDTISYVKLNSFNEVLLTLPTKNNLKEGQVYGLIQDNTVGGTAVVRGGNLYGYLSSNKRCRFSVFIGKNRTPGIAEGVEENKMLIKYIPKWAKIAVGDKIETSGLDDIFFANIPIGTVESVKVENSYKTAYIKTFADTLHPDFFFLITDAKPRLTSHYDQNSSFADDVYTQEFNTNSSNDRNISSIPTAHQTRESEIDLSEFEIPKEELTPTPPIVNTTKKKVKKRLKKKKKVKTKPKARPQPSYQYQQTPQATQKPAPKRRNPLDIFR